MEHHPQNFTSIRTLNACTSCRERKLRCDNSVPCQSCTRNSTECNRVIRGQGNVTRRAVDTDYGVGSSIENERGLMGANRNSRVEEMAEMVTLLPEDAHEQPWFRLAPDSWSLPLPSPAELNAPFPTDFDANETSHWNANPCQRDYVENALSLSSSGGQSLTLPSNNNSQAESMTGGPQDDAPQVGESVLSLAFPLPVSPDLAKNHRVSALQRFLGEESASDKRRIRVYFECIHSSWPILHAPTFDAKATSPVLLGAMTLLAGWLTGELDHSSLAPLVLDAVTARVPVRLSLSLMIMGNP